MKSYKKSRNSEDIKREISAVIRELKDPRLKSELISVVRIEVSGDFSFCKVYISSIEGSAKASEAVDILKSAKGFVRHEISQRLQVRHVPEIVFCATDAIEQSANISRILEDLK